MENKFQLYVGASTKWGVEGWCGKTEVPLLPGLLEYQSQKKARNRRMGSQAAHAEKI